VKTIDGLQKRVAHTVNGLPKPPLPDPRDGMNRLTNLYQEQSATFAARAPRKGMAT
jgi:hypothetical protein